MTKAESPRTNLETWIDARLEGRRRVQVVDETFYQKFAEIDERTLRLVVVLLLRGLKGTCLQWEGVDDPRAAALIDQLIPRVALGTLRFDHVGKPYVTEACGPPPSSEAISRWTEQVNLAHRFLPEAWEREIPTPDSRALVSLCLEDPTAFSDIDGEYFPTFVEMDEMDIFSYCVSLMDGANRIFGPLAAAGLGPEDSRVIDLFDELFFLVAREKFILDKDVSWDSLSSDEIDELCWYQIEEAHVLLPRVWDLVFFDACLYDDTDIHLAGIISHMEPLFEQEPTGWCEI